VEASAARARFWERGGNTVTTWRRSSDVIVLSVFCLSAQDATNQRD
jgi:hypothetical protein